MISSQDNERLVVCPFNVQHKNIHPQRLQFHLSRCPDKKRYEKLGMDVFHCKWDYQHICFSKEELLRHERTCVKQKMLLAEEIDRVGQRQGISEEVQEERKVPQTVISVKKSRNYFYRGQVGSRPSNVILDASAWFGIRKKSNFEEKKVVEFPFGTLQEEIDEYYRRMEDNSESKMIQPDQSCQASETSLLQYNMIKNIGNNSDSHF